jgi:hypothetical protein
METTVKDKNNKKQFKLIKISEANWKILTNLGKTNDTYNSVLTRIFEENNLLGVVTENGK